MGQNPASDFTPKKTIETVDTAELDAASRSDFIFIVTPDNVFVDDLRGEDDQTEGAFVPYRFTSADFCPRGTDDPKSDSRCSTKAKEVIYNVYLPDITNPDTDGKPTFPVCAVRPIQ